VHRSTGVVARMTALLRYFTARQYHVALFGWYSPSLGAIVNVLIMVVFFTGE
jgi:hypothetical protein